MRVFGSHPINLNEVLNQNKGVSGIKKMSRTDIDNEKIKNVGEISMDIAAQRANEVALDNQLNNIKNAVAEKKAYYDEDALIPRVKKLFHTITFNIFNPVKWSKNTNEKLANQYAIVQGNINELNTVLRENTLKDIKERLDSDPDLANLGSKFSGVPDITKPLGEKVIAFKEILAGAISNKMKAPSDKDTVDRAIDNLKKNLLILRNEFDGQILASDNVNNNNAFARFLFESDLSSEDEYLRLGFLLSFLDDKNHPDQLIRGGTAELQDFSSFKADYEQTLEKVKENGKVKGLVEDYFQNDQADIVHKIIALLVGKNRKPDRNFGIN